MVKEIFRGFLSEATIEDIKENQETYEQTPIKNLGIDSLATMDLVLRIEDLVGREFDYDIFDIDDVSTVGRVIKLYEDFKGDQK
ncbi:phosphopantetheine-binding protein [Streptococcaceae bacterium ESL0687]|nr:phosphopantetheine-binding protein [Streptococcaceae bacterium ESL0687]